jgi:hypothetical protein
MVFRNPLVVESESLDFLLKNNDSQIVYDNTPQWTMISLDDFQGNSIGWSKDKLSNCGTSDNMFLGGHCNFANEEAKKVFTDIPKHQMVIIYNLGEDNC